MKNADLGRSYMIKAEKRLKTLDVLLREEDYSDVIRESQEVVELCLKGMLRIAGIEPPKFHDVGSLIIEYKERFKGIPPGVLRKATRISKQLRKERELAFYGDIDFIPTEEYSKGDALKAMKDASWVVDVAKRFIRDPLTPFAKGG